MLYLTYKNIGVNMKNAKPIDLHKINEWDLELKLDKNQKKAITTTNEAVKKMLYDYTKMDESTPQAAAIRKMVKRLGENDIPVNNSDYYLAMSITHKKPLMSKTYIDTFNISPAKNIPIATRDASRFYMI